MPVITRIEPQQKQRDRFSIYLDKAFAFGVYANTLAKINLQVGDEISQDRQREIVALDRWEKALHGILEFIAYRERCESEIKDWLYRKEFNDLRDEMISYLQEKDYLNEERFVELFTKEKARLRGWGPTRLRHEMIKKRIPRSLIDSALSRIEEEFDFNSEAMKLASKKYAQLKQPTMQDKKRIYNFLQRRGYNSETINKTLSSFEFRSGSE